MRFAAHLLFEYRVSLPVRKRRTAEAQVVVFRSRDERSALRKAVKIGRQRQVRYKNKFGGTVSIAFLGLIDLLELTPCLPDEVWYRLFETSNPRRFLTPTRSLSVFAATPDKRLEKVVWSAPRSLARKRPSRSLIRRRRRPVA